MQSDNDVLMLHHRIMGLIEGLRELAEAGDAEAAEYLCKLRDMAIEMREGLKENQAPSEVTDEGLNKMLRDLEGAILSRNSRDRCQG